MQAPPTRPCQRLSPSRFAAHCSRGEALALSNAPAAADLSAPRRRHAQLAMKAPLSFPSIRALRIAGPLRTTGSAGWAKSMAHIPVHGTVRLSPTSRLIRQPHMAALGWSNPRGQDLESARTGECCWRGMRGNGLVQVPLIRVSAPGRPFRSSGGRFPARVRFAPFRVARWRLAVLSWTLPSQRARRRTTAGSSGGTSYPAGCRPRLTTARLTEAARLGWSGT